MRVWVRQTPAALMRPKAPRAGSRILLERIRPVWNRIGFLGKVTARNIDGGLRGPTVAMVAVRIAERRAKLLGLDAPIRAMQEVTVTGNDQPNMGHLSVEDLEGIKQKLYGGQKLLANAPAEGEPEQ